MKRNKLTRRAFLKGLIISLISFEFIYILNGLLKNKSIGSKKSTLYNAGEIASFKNGHIYPFGEQNFYLSKFEDGSMLALSTKCTHLGCKVKLLDDKFICPCHSSSFNKYGEVLSHPATRPLDIYPLKIEKGFVMVDINSPIKRKVYKMSQLTKT